MQKRILLSFDVEDWFQVENFRKVFPHEVWNNCQIRAVNNTFKILDLLDKYEIKATFFVLGWIAQKVPHLVKEIFQRGHEVACHGYSHIINYSIPIEKIFNDIERAKFTLEDIIGDEVVGYRAPNFSIFKEVFDVLEKLGFYYDSSYHPFFKNKRYGRLKIAKRDSLFFVRDQLVEIPMSVNKILNIDVSVAGGGYFRLMPYFMFNWLASRYLDKYKMLVLYFHPWEFDPGQPKVNGVQINYRIRHYVGIKSSIKKIEKFIDIQKQKGSIFEIYKDVAKFYLSRNKDFKNE